MRQKSKFLFYSFLLLFLTSISVVDTKCVTVVARQSSYTVQDENLQAFMVMDRVNVTDAYNEENSILVDPVEGVLARIEYIAVGDQPLDIIEFKTVVIVSDFDAISQKDKLDVTLSPADNFTFIQAWKFKNYVGTEQLALISGVYRLRYDLHYRIQGQTHVLKGKPFYVRFNSNPMASVFGVVSTISFAATGFSLFRLLLSLRNSMNMELAKSIEASKVSPSTLLQGYYRNQSFTKVQAQVTSTVFNYAMNLWKGEKCPKCKAIWPPDSDVCKECQLTREEADEYYANTVVDKSLKASKEVVDSVSGLDVSSIAGSLGSGITPTLDIVYVLSSSGLALVEPRLSKSWTDKTRKIVFTGLQTAFYSLFWIQTCGISVVSITMLSIAILSGFILPIIIGKVLGSNLMNRLNLFWGLKKERT